MNGSTRKNGCTYAALDEIAEALAQEGIAAEIVQMGAAPVRDCLGCNQCVGKGRCVFADDLVNQWLEKAQKADGFILGSPVYYAHPTGQFLAMLDRLFYAGGHCFAHKPGAAVVSARRAGTTASLEVLNKYFANAQMPMVGSTYWNMVHGTAPEQVKQDLEGLQTLRNLARNMAWLLRCIEAGRRQGYEPPQGEQKQWTNFIR